MSSKDEPLPSWERSQQPSAEDKSQALAEMYDGHAVHVFDYCYAIVGNRNRAAAATQATFVAGHTLSDHLRDPGRLRPWLMALASRECQDSPSERAVARASAAHSRRELAEALAFIDAADDDVDDDTDDDTGERSGTDLDNVSKVRRVLQKLSTEQREMLNLVYRYGIDTYELPTILGIDAASVAELLTDAEARFTEAVRLLDQTNERAARAADLADDAGIWADQIGDWTDDNGWAEDNGWAYLPTDSRTEAGHWTDEDGWTAQDEASQPRTGLAWLSVVPLSTLPASVWQRTSRAVLDPKFRSYREAIRVHAEHLGPDGFPIPTEDPVSPSFRRLLVTSALLACLLLAPVGLGWAGYAEFGGAAASKVPHAHSMVMPVKSTPASPARPSPTSIGTPSGRPTTTARPSPTHTPKTAGNPVGDTRSPA